jgi:hypothetical protein
MFVLFAPSSDVRVGIISGGFVCSCFEYSLYCEVLCCDSHQVLATAKFTFTRFVTPTMETIHKYSSTLVMPLASRLLLAGVSAAIAMHLRAFSDSLTPEETQRWQELLNAKLAVVKHSQDVASKRRAEAQEKLMSDAGAPTVESK